MELNCLIKNIQMSVGNEKTRIWFLCVFLDSSKNYLYSHVCVYFFVTCSRSFHESTLVLAPAKLHKRGFGCWPSSPRLFRSNPISELFHCLVLIIPSFFVLCQCGGDIPLVPSVWLRILVATNKKKIFFEQKARVGNIIFTRWGNCAFFTWFWISEGMGEGDFVKVDHTARDRKFVAEWWVFFYPLCHFI